jgi:general L-amino acid transport system substrate-binding protein
MCIAVAGLLFVASVSVAQAETSAAATLANAPQTATAVPSAAGQTTLEKIRAKGFVQCGMALRPGLASADAKGHWSGLNFEICRAIAIAALGKDARFAIHQYDSANNYDPLRKGDDDVAFLTYPEIAAQKLTGQVLPGLPVFIETHDLLVAVDSPVKHAAELNGAAMCFIMETAPEDSLEAWAGENKITLIRLAFRETDEMFDAYAVQRCKSVIGESTELAAQRLHGGVNHLKSRFLPEHLASFPILAATPLKADSQWAAIVDWTLRTLMVADAKETYYRANGLRALEIDGESLGLAKDWQKVLVEKVGSYSAIFDRNLGAGSPLKLDPGLNAPAVDGHILLSYPRQ